ncbi:15701_t:CDS:2, partial [Funneliformis caledonium]
DLLDQKQFSDLILILDGKLKELAEVEHYKLKFNHFHKKYDRGYDINNEQTRFASDEHKQNSSKTSDTISTPSFRTALQVVK